MKKKEKIVIIVLIIDIVLIVSLILFVGNHKNETKNEKDNTENKIYDDTSEELKTINLLENMNIDKYETANFDIIEMKLVISPVNSSLQGVLVGKTEEKIDTAKFKIILYDDNNNKVYDFEVEAYDLISGEKIEFMPETPEDISSAYSFSIEEY